MGGNDLVYAGLTTTTEMLDAGPGIDTLDTTSINGPYTVNLLNATTCFASESFTNFENLISGNGNDTYFLDNAGDVVIEAIGSGVDTTDTVVTSVNFRQDIMTSALGVGTR